MTRLDRPPPRSPLVRTLHSFGPATAGVMAVVHNQPNIKVQLAIGAIVLTLAAWLRVPATDGAILLLCVGLVLALELMNSAVEAAVDLASPDLHPLAKLAKDAAAGAVLVASLFSAAVGALLLGPPLWTRMF